MDLLHLNTVWFILKLTVKLIPAFQHVAQPWYIANYRNELSTGFYLQLMLLGHDAPQSST